MTQTPGPNTEPTGTMARIDRALLGPFDAARGTVLVRLLVCFAVLAGAFYVWLLIAGSFRAPALVFAGWIVLGVPYYLLGRFAAARLKRTAPPRADD